MLRRSLPRLIAPLASLELTIVGLILSMLLIFFGTLAQTTRGIWWVMDQYFTSWTVMVPFEIFTPPGSPVPGAFPFPGGALLGLVLLVNLVVAHSLRYKVTARGGKRWLGYLLLIVGAAMIVVFHQASVFGQIKADYGLAAMMLAGLLMYVPALIATALLYGRRVGIVLIHGSLILLIVGEGVTRVTAVEANMPIYEGEAVNWVQDMRQVELAVIDPTDPDHDRVTVIPEAVLRRAYMQGQPISHPDLPFDVRIDAYYINSTFRQRGVAVEPPPAAMQGLGRQLVLEPVAEVSGVGGQMYNLPGAQLTLVRDGVSLGVYQLSVVTTFIGDAYRTMPQDVAVDGKNFAIDLRFERHYKPYTIRLDDFHHDLYPGTQVPKNYASDIHLTDPTTGEDRQIKISMNQPLRYAGETFFQSSYIQGDLGTVLQVVNNPGWTVPYIACSLGGAGLVIHFTLSLTRFLRRRRI